MRKNEDEISAEQLRRLAQSDAGRQLMAMLKGSNAASAVQSGDMEEAVRAVSAFLKSPAARELAKKLEAQEHG